MKALAIHETTFEYGHPSLSTSHYNISVSYLKMKQLDNALKHMDIAYKMGIKHDPALKHAHTKLYK